METFRLLNKSLDRALDIPRKLRIMYGMINHAVHGIVTATDNIIDDEYNEMLPFLLTPRAFRFKSVMHLLLFERFLFQVVDEGVQNGVIERFDREVIYRAL